MSKIEIAATIITIIVFFALFFVAIQKNEKTIYPDGELRGDTPMYNNTDGRINYAIGMEPIGNTFLNEG